MIIRSRSLLPLVWLTAVCATGAVTVDPNLERAQIKVDAILSHKVQPGYAVTFSEAEVNALATDVAARKFSSVQNSHIQLKTGVILATASVDFLRVRKPDFLQSIPAIARLLETQAPVSVECRVESSAGRAKVSPMRVEIANVPMTGSVLEFLVSKFVNPLFPEAVVNRPFELRDDLERLEVRPGALRVVMKR